MQHTHTHTVSASLSALFDKYYYHHREIKTAIRYGTAGFRMKADDVLLWTACTVGILATLRSMHFHHHYHYHARGGAESASAMVGVMITASHNAWQDNGVKVCDPPHGEMLHVVWEKHAELLANSHSAQELVGNVQRILEETTVESTTAAAGEAVVAAEKRGASLLQCLSAHVGVELPARIYIGRDTRPSSKQLHDTIVDTLRTLNVAQIIDAGVVTTPQLHWLATRANSFQSGSVADIASVVNESQYFDTLCNAYRQLVQGEHGKADAEEKPKKLLWIDCANGVGARKIQPLQERLSDLIRLRPFNDRTSEADCELLNHQCGAEHVQKNRVAPANHDPSKMIITASMDGDADRVVYFLNQQSGGILLLDGDRIASLFAMLFERLLKQANLTDTLTMGVVQTAYANGASTRFLRESVFQSNAEQESVSCVPTGVKHLHHRALIYDIGIYFEANGHGTVLFSDHALKAISNGKGQNRDDKTVSLALHRLGHLSQLINQSVGDALSDILAVEAALQLLDMTHIEWAALYQDMPCLQRKVPVPDRTAMKTTWDEMRVVEPRGMQDKIDAAMAQCGSNSGARSFVRPSGTEDVVRIYAEATIQEIAEMLASTVEGIVKRELLH